MHRAVEWYALVTCIVVGLSHLLQSRAWAEAYAKLHRVGVPGAFINGAMSLFPGAAFALLHPVWSGPAAGLTVLGWALVLKGTVCFLVPNLALRSMQRAGASNGRPFVAAGGICLLFAIYLGYVLCTG